MNVLLYPALALISVPLLVCGVTLALAALTWLRWRRNNDENDNKLYSALYVGRVSHTRYHPAVHSFAYPFFWMAVELNTEADELWFGSVRSKKLWPLSIVMSLRPCDHYKNGEGLHSNGNSTALSERQLAQRTLQLVQERTKHSFRPTLDTHRVVLLTHLCYFGYCFNPVSFYYVFEKKKTAPCAIVAEVSNTPWNEMQCYVLHESSVDVTSVRPTASSINYVFPKTFHVSPFMEMTYDYDWTFTRLPIDTSKTANNKDEPLEITTAMVRTDDTSKNRQSRLQFRAHVSLQRQDLHPFTCAMTLLKFPVYCVLVQLWIHYEAFWLFVKGIRYQPHPDESETTASRIIGTAMAPLFAFKDWIDGKDKDKKN